MANSLFKKRLLKLAVPATILTSSTLLTANLISSPVPIEALNSIDNSLDDQESLELQEEMDKDQPKTEENQKSQDKEDTDSNPKEKTQTSEDDVQEDLEETREEQEEDSSVEESKSEENEEQEEKSEDEDGEKQKEEDDKEEEKQKEKEQMLQLNDGGQLIVGILKVFLNPENGSDSSDSSGI